MSKYCIMENLNLKKHFLNPSNTGEIGNPDASGTGRRLACSGHTVHIKLTAKIKKNIISDIKFRAAGCNYTIAAASYLTTLIKNRDILDCTLITEKTIEEYLGEFPPEKKYVLNAVIDTLTGLITDYISKPRTSNIYKESKNRVAVAMSGGIDSSMAAKILKDKGYKLIGITLKLLPDDFNPEKNKKTCCSERDIKAARKAALKLNIPHVVLDLIQPFRERIIEPFCMYYKKGLTPNPCVDCNKFIKFGILLEKARSLGAAFTATGHYCRIEKSKESALYEIKKGIDISKDQSYMLWRLSREQLSHIKTPLGELLKGDVKTEIKRVFPFLKKKDESQDICFIPGNNYHSFLKTRLKNIKKGPILDTEGNTIGTHRGYIFYTIGQRKGLGISYPEPLYVKEIIPEDNTIIAGVQKDIMQKTLKVKNTNFIAGYPPGKIFRAAVRIRYNSPESPAEIKITGRKTAVITFDNPRKAITPGQSAVFYDKDTLLGGGIISKH